MPCENVLKFNVEDETVGELLSVIKSQEFNFFNDFIISLSAF